MFIFNDVIDAHTTAPIEEDYINKEEEEDIPELFVQFWYVPRLSSWVCTRIVPTIRISIRKNGTLGTILVLLNELFSNFDSVTSLRIYTRR